VTSFSGPKPFSLGTERQSQGLLQYINPQGQNRYSYVLNNPLKYSDPSGNWVWIVVGAVVGGLVGLGAYALTHRGNFNWGQAALWAAGGALIGAGAGWAAEGLLAGSAAVASTEVAVTAAWQKMLGSFSQAANYGVQTYNALSAKIAGMGLNAHHLIEKRFAGILGVNQGHMPSIALTPAEHKIFTDAWASAISYKATDSANWQTIWNAAQKIYANYPDLLSLMNEWLNSIK
jgi:hypothetical protein